MTGGEIIAIVALASGVAILAWIFFAPHDKKALTRKLRKGLRRAGRKSIRKNDGSK